MSATTLRTGCLLGVALLALPGLGLAQGFTSGALGPALQDQRHKLSDYAPGDKRPSRQTVLDVPLHSQGGDDLRKLQGPFQYVKGELLVWSYAFQYWGTGANNSRVALQTGQTLTYVGMVGKNYQFSTPGTGVFTVIPPPNVNIDQILNFAIVPLAACNKIMVLNRLGKPTEQTSDTTSGETKFVYQRSVHRDYEDQEVYHFEVTFDAHDQVTGVEDKTE